MKYISIPYFSIALDTMGLIIVAIIFLSCLTEQIREKNRSRSFLLLLACTIVTLVADIAAWLGEGHPPLRMFTLVSSTVASCACFLAILYFLDYMMATLFPTSRAGIVIFSIVATVCLASILLLIGNIFVGYAFTVDAEGHIVHTDEVMVAGIYLTFPLLSFLAILLSIPLSKGKSPVARISFVLYALCPVVGAVVDLFILGLSMTYVGFIISVLLIYTGIYRQKQKMIVAQQNALMLSQINPHFMYNTLSTMAAMCDINPQQAKQLTLEFSQYLRHNLKTLTCEELIPFSQEMNHVECYLNIEKARFQENINVVYSIQCKDFSVPPLSIQPIVENAVRHGITRKAGGGTVRISTRVTKKHYVIEVRDDGVGFDTATKPQDNRKHVGLENVSNRIHRMCRGRVAVRSVIGVGTRVTIAIPKKYAHPKKEEAHEYTSR